MPEYVDRLKLGSVVLAFAVVWSGVAIPRLYAEPIVQVYKTPTCGCCQGWVDHLRAEGFSVRVEELDDLTAIKHMAGVPDHLQACHTATVDGYTIEGHVPAVAIERLLDEQPDISGLAVPGMPLGSPGMPSATPEHYDVTAFDEDGAGRFGSFVGTEPQ